MELSSRSAFSGLIGHRVVDQAGNRMGRVYEVRGRWQPDGSIVLETLMVGALGLWQRLQGPRPGSRAGIPWEAVLDIREDAIVVRR